MFLTQSEVDNQRPANTATFFIGLLLWGPSQEKSNWLFLFGKTVNALDLCW